MKHLPAAARRAAPQRCAVGAPAAVLRGVLEHDKPIGQQPSAHVLHVDRLVLWISHRGHPRGDSLVAELAAGTAELVEVRREQPIQPGCVSPARRAQRLLLGGDGRARRAAMSVVPEGLRCAAGAPDTGPGAGSYCMDASFMLFLRHGCGIHAVWSNAGVAGVTETRFRCTPRPAARRERTMINLSSPGMRYRWCCRY